MRQFLFSKTSPGSAGQPAIGDIQSPHLEELTHHPSLPVQPLLFLSFLFDFLIFFFYAHSATERAPKRSSGDAVGQEGRAGKYIPCGDCILLALLLCSANLVAR